MWPSQVKNEVEIRTKVPTKPKIKIFICKYLKVPWAYVKLNPAMPLSFYYYFSLLILFVFCLFVLCFFFLSYFNLISLQNEIYQNGK